MENNDTRDRAAYYHGQTVRVTIERFETADLYGKNTKRDVRGNDVQSGIACNAIFATGTQPVSKQREREREKGVEREG